MLCKQPDTNKMNKIKTGAFWYSVSQIENDKKATFAEWHNETDWSINFCFRYMHTVTIKISQIGEKLLKHVGKIHNMISLNFYHT